MSAQAPALPRAGITIAFLLLTSAVTISLGIYKVTQRHQIIQIGYELSEAGTELRELKEANRQLRLEKSVLTHPERIERLARARGMALPTPDQIRVVRTGEVAAAP